MVEDEDRPRRVSTTHEIGQKLDDLSLRDFEERIDLLRREMHRLELAREAKARALDDAGSVFRR